MALKKEIKFKTGYSANYWRIPQVSFNKDGAWAELELYKDEEARRAGCVPVETLKVQLEAAHINTGAAASPIQQAYAAVMVMPDFKDAECVIEAATADDLPI